MGRKLVSAGAGVALGCLLALAPQTGVAEPRLARAEISKDVSSQDRQTRRGPTRLRVTPLPGKLERDCVPVFQERWIPQWGGWVLRAGQSCRWVRVPY